MKIWNKGREKRTKSSRDAQDLSNRKLCTGHSTDYWLQSKAPSMMEANYTRPPTPSMKAKQVVQIPPRKGPLEDEIADSHNSDLEQ